MFGEALHHLGNLLYSIRESLYRTIGASIFSVIIVTLGKNVEKTGFEEVAQNLQKSLDLLTLSKCGLPLQVLVLFLEGPSGCLIAKSSGFSHPYSD